MESRIQTSKLEDLLAIFDPTAQETQDTGGARILYTFDQNGQPQRQRVGDQFILDVLEPPVTFFVSVPVNEYVAEGEIFPSTQLDGVETKYSLEEKDLERLVLAVSLATGYGSEEEILALIEQ